MRSGRNDCNSVTDFTDILAYWEMRSGRNSNLVRSDALQILAYWEMRSGRNPRGGPGHSGPHSSLLGNALWPERCVAVQLDGCHSSLLGNALWPEPKAVS